MALNTLYRKELIDLEETCRSHGYSLRNDSLYDFRWFITCDSTRVFIKEFDLRDYHENCQRGGRVSLQVFIGGLGEYSWIHPARSMVIWRKQPLTVALVNEALFNPKNEGIIFYADGNILANANSELCQFPEWKMKLHVCKDVNPGVMNHRATIEFSADSEEDLITRMKQWIPDWVAEFSIPSRVDPFNSHL